MPPVPNPEGDVKVPNAGADVPDPKLEAEGPGDPKAVPELEPSPGLPKTGAVGGLGSVPRAKPKPDPLLAFPKPVLAVFADPNIGVLEPEGVTPVPVPKAVELPEADPAVVPKGDANSGCPKPDPNTEPGFILY